MRTSRALLVGIGLLVGLVASASVALAQAEQSALEGKFRAGDTVVVPADETVTHDLYATGGTVRVEGTVEGDLVASGGEIHVSGTVTGDAMLAGGSATISGSVEGDARVAAGRIAVGGEIGEDLLAAGGQLSLEQGSRIGEDFVFAGGEVRTAADIGGDVLGSTGRYEQRGTVAGQEQVEVTPAAERPGPGGRVADAVRRYLSLLVVAALLLWLAPRLTRRSADTLQRQPLPALGVGLAGAVGGVVAIVVVIVVAILLAVLFGLLTLGGLAGLLVAVGFVAAVVTALLLFIALGFLAHVVVALWIGRLAVREVASWARALGAVAIGLVAIVVVTALPVVGGWAGLLIALVGLGALLLALRQRRRPLPEPPMPPSPPQTAAEPKPAS